ncbi:hypothetical protein A6g_05005 [Bacillus velezensis]|nr:hypothetical protein CVD07_08835 [Bacillus velezensis]RXK30906.1 hypothetical protein A6g_05005 [Bacillus velezensis]SLC51946.1 Uncharacterised protein [Mycobacteroides abscessus subsp. massiliense]
MKLLHHAEPHTKRYREIIVNENIHHFPGKRSIRQIKTNHKGTEGTIQGGCLRVCGADKVIGNDDGAAADQLKRSIFPGKEYFFNLKLL